MVCTLYVKKIKHLTKHRLVLTHQLERVGQLCDLSLVHHQYKVVQPQKSIRVAF
jgi:hypothetical protein